MGSEVLDAHLANLGNAWRYQFKAATLPSPGTLVSLYIHKEKDKLVISKAELKMAEESVLCEFLPVVVGDGNARWSYSQ